MNRNNIFWQRFTIALKYAFWTSVVKTEDIHPPKTGISVHFCVLSLMAMQN